MNGSPKARSVASRAWPATLALANRLRCLLAGRTNKYYVTPAGRSVMTTGLKLKTLVLIPELARAMAA